MPNPDSSRSKLARMAARCPQADASVAASDSMREQHRKVSRPQHLSGHSAEYQ
jgi:hypothetical protein